MIKILKNIVVFGYPIAKGCTVIPPNDVTNTGTNILTVSYFNKKGSGCVVPLVCERYGKIAIQFLDEICRINTNQTYYEYNDDQNAIEYQKFISQEYKLIALKKQKSEGKKNKKTANQNQAENT